MTIYTYSEASKKLSSLLEQAIEEGEVRIKSRKGRRFIIKPDITDRSPLDVEGVNLNINTEEIVRFIHEGRKK